MTLREYQKRNGLTVQALADLLDLSIGHTADILNARSGCSLSLAMRIEEKTNGKVRCRDLPTTPARA